MPILSRQAGGTWGDRISVAGKARAQLGIFHVDVLSDRLPRCRQDGDEADQGDDGEAQHHAVDAERREEDGKK